MVLETLVEQRTGALLDGRRRQTQRAATVLDGHSQLASRLVAAGFIRRVVHVLGILVTNRATLGAQHLSGTQPHVHTGVLHFPIFRRLLRRPFAAVERDVLKIRETLVDCFAHQIFVRGSFRRRFGRSGRQGYTRRNSPTKRTIKTFYKIYFQLKNNGSSFLGF